MRAIAVGGDGASVDEALAAVRRQPAMAGRALAARGLDAGAVRLPRGRATSTSPSSTTARSARSCAASRARARGDRLPARRRRRHARGARRRPALERPRRPGAARDRGRDRARAARPDAGARHLPRPPAARRSPPGTRRSSCRSATAARTTRSSSARAAACSSRARTTASRSRPTEEREATHVSLYDGTVEGFRFPELRARSVQFHPEAGPGPHDAWPILAEFVEELRDA